MKITTIQVEPLLWCIWTKEFIKASLTDLNRVRLPFIVADLKGKDDGGTFTNKVYVAGDGIHDLENANPDRVTEDVYDLSRNGSTTDKIPYAQSNYTIVAAEGIYARKYIAKMMIYPMHLLLLVPSSLVKPLTTRSPLKTIQISRSKTELFTMLYQKYTMSIP